MKLASRLRFRASSGRRTCVRIPFLTSIMGRRLTKSTPYERHSNAERLAYYFVYQDCQVAVFIVQTRGEQFHQSLRFMYEYVERRRTETPMSSMP